MIDNLLSNALFSIVLFLFLMPFVIWRITSKYNKGKAEIFKRVDEEIEKNIELQKEYSMEKEKLMIILEELRKEKEALICKHKPIKPKVPKPIRYNKPKTLYIALDFNIRGNMSFKETVKHIDSKNETAAHTTLIHFLDDIYLNRFDNIYVIKKSGHYIDVKEFKTNPYIYTKMINTPLSLLINDDKNLKFKKDKKDL